MIPTLRVLMHMGSLQRLAPFWLAGLVLMITLWSPWMVFALIYGVIMQFLTEYGMHRFLYHKEPSREQSPFNEQYRSHIGHHEFPTNPEFFTGGDHWYALRFGLASFALHCLVLWPLFGAVGVLFGAIAIFVGAISAFAFYEYCHTLAHLNVKKGWFGQQVTRSHLAHHFQDHEASFHVSFGMGWIDHLFGTAHDREIAKERFDRETILSLGMDPEDLRLVTARKAYGLPDTPGKSAG